MKHIGKRIGGLLLAAALLLSALPAGAASAEELYNVPQAEPGIERSQTADGSFVSLMTSFEGQDGGAAGMIESKAFGASAAGYDQGDMKSQLNKRQKTCYDFLENLPFSTILSAAQVSNGDEAGTVYHRVTPKLEGFLGVTMTGSMGGGQLQPDAASKAVEAGIYTDLLAAITALRYDRPDLLWLDFLRFGYIATKSPDATTATVSHVILDFYLKYEGNEANMMDVMMAQARLVADGASQCQDTYSKVLYIHDTLAAWNTYGDTSDHLSHTAYSALIEGDGHEPVCDGYAEAIKIVCNLLEIPCATPSSEDHKWNNVKMDDGEWYNIDLTWDDGETLSYDCFLVGSQTEIGGVPFCLQPNHVERNPYEAVRKPEMLPVSLVFPTKNAKAYEYQGQDYPPLAFPDVKRSAWYFKSVEDAAARGLFKGNPEGLFQPGKNITRAEFAVVMSKAMGADLSQYGGAYYTDVPADIWCAPAVAWATESKLMKGYTNGFFRPNAPITREEMCAVLSAAIPEGGESTGFSFPDDWKIGSWAKKAVYRCHALGLISGNANGTFAPKDNTLRSQAASVFSRFMKLKENPAA